MILTGLTGLLIISCILSINLGFAQIEFPTVMRVLAGRLPLLGPRVDTSGISRGDQSIILQIRLPRIIAGVLVGIALASAGVVYQGIFRNPMADPYVIGVSAGAALGAALAIVLGLGFQYLGVNTVPIFAFFGALGTIFLVYNLSRVGTKVPVTPLLLSGIAVSIFLSAIVSVLQVFSGERLHQLIFWLMGGFSYTEWNDLWGIFPLIGLGIILIYLHARALNILALGDETAQHLGVEVERVRRLLLVSATLTTASAVSVGGLIGFVGLIIPHLARLLMGPDHRILIPTSIILGAFFLVMCDAIARVILAPVELPVGVITSLTGGPFFLYLLKKRKHTYGF